MSRCKKLIILALTLSFNTFVFANTPNAPFPRGCENSGYGFQKGYVTFNASGQQMLFFLHNTANILIELEHVETQRLFMSPKLQTKLGPSQWAAFASDISNTHFRCITRTEETVTAVDCSRVLSICQYPRVKFALSNMGSYWVSTNKPLAQVIQDATAKGIYLKW